MEWFNGILDLLVLIDIAIGAFECFFGYRFFKVLLALLGFVIGGAIAGGVGYAISDQQGTVLVYALIGGIVGAVLLYALYFVGVFLVGALFGLAIGEILYAFSHSSPSSAVLLILAIIGGIAALLIQKFIIILATSFGGAWEIVSGIAHFAWGRGAPIAITPSLEGLTNLARAKGSFWYAEILAWLLLGTFGFLVQYGVLFKGGSSQSYDGVPPLSSGS